MIVERPFLSPLPRARFDTDYVLTRRVHNIVPFVAVDGARYSVPPEVLGQLVEVRRKVDADELTIRCAGKPIATHQIAAAGDVVWDATHQAATEKIALSGGRSGRDSRHLRLVDDTPPLAVESVGPLCLGDGDYDVDPVDLEQRYGIDGSQQ